MGLLKKKQETIAEKLIKLVKEGKAQLNKDLGKEVKAQLEELASVAQKALTTKHKADLGKMKEKLKEANDENKALAAALKEKTKTLDKINKLTLN